LPAPSSVIVTFVTIPPNVLFETVTAEVPHVLPVVALRVNVGHCPSTSSEISKNRGNKRNLVILME
jgi:hypothetical protein